MSMSSLRLVHILPLQHLHVQDGSRFESPCATEHVLGILRHDSETRDVTIPFSIHCFLCKTNEYTHHQAKVANKIHGCSAFVSNQKGSTSFKLRNRLKDPSDISDFEIPFFQCELRPQSRWQVQCCFFQVFIPAHLFWIAMYGDMMEKILHQLGCPNFFFKPIILKPFRAP